MDRIGALLKPDGMAYILVPDAVNYAEFMVAPFQDVNIEHINHFSLTALNNLFAMRGWKQESSGRDVFYLSPTWQSTLIWGLYRKGGVSLQPLGSDQALREGLKDYFEKSAAMLDAMTARLENDLENEQEIMLWGAGHATSVLLAHGVLEKKSLRGIIDSNPNYIGRFLAGAPVGGHELRGNFDGPIVVATVREQDSIVSQIKALGWSNRIVRLRTQ